MKICAVIQASGMSKRMGKDKLRLPVKGLAMYKHIINEVSKINFDKALIVSKDFEILEYGKAQGLIPVLNEEYEEGQSRSIVLSLKELKDFDAVMFMVSDQPFLKAETIEYLIEEYKKIGSGILLPLYKGKRGSPVLFSSKYADELMSLKGEERGRSVINKYIYDVAFVEIDDELQGIDIDNIEDYERYCI